MQAPSWDEAFRRSPIGIAQVGLEGSWDRVNASLASMLGYTEDELTALTFQQVTHPDDLDADLHLLRETLAGQRSSYRITKRYLHRLGHVVWVDLSVTLVHGDDGRPAYFISQIIDISALHADRERMARQARALLRKQEELEACNAMLESFVATVSHDLKSPLTVMRGWLEHLVDEGDLSEHQLDALDRVRRSADRLDGLVDALLHYAFSTREASTTEQLDLDDDVLRPVLDDLGEQLAAARASVHAQLRAPQVVGSPRLLQTALTNLVANAVKHHPGPGPAHVSVTSEAVDGDRVRLVVSDDGQAPDGDLTRLTEIFARATDTAPGSGIGLATVRRIARWHGGEIELDRTADGGLEVALVLPRDFHDDEVVTVEPLLAVGMKPADELARELARELAQELAG